MDSYFSLTIDNTVTLGCSGGNDQLLERAAKCQFCYGLGGRLSCQDETAANVRCVDVSTGGGAMELMDLGSGKYCYRVTALDANGTPLGRMQDTFRVNSAAQTGQGE